MGGGGAGSCSMGWFQLDMPTGRNFRRSIFDFGFSIFDFRRGTAEVARLGRGGIGVSQSKIENPKSEIRAAAALGAFARLGGENPSGPSLNVPEIRAFAALSHARHETVTNER